jgi:hypothetical protein
MLHFRDRIDDDDDENETRDFYYPGPTCIIRPQEVVVCVPCVCPLKSHQYFNRQTCQLKTFSGWQEITKPCSVTVFVLDNSTDKTFVLDNGETLCRFLSAVDNFGIKPEKCQIGSESVFEYENTMEVDDFEEEDEDDNTMETDSGIDGDVNPNVVRIAFESVVKNSYSF